MAQQHIERAPFGRTGHLSSRVIFGAAGIGTMKRQEKADELLPLLSPDIRRNIQRLRAYPERTAGAVMTTRLAPAARCLVAPSRLEMKNSPAWRTRKYV